LDVAVTSRFYDDFFYDYDSKVWTLVTGGASDPAGTNGFVRLKGGGSDALEFKTVQGGTILPYKASKNPILKVREAQYGGAATRRFGLSATALTSDPNNGIYWKHTNAGNYTAVCRSGGVETPLDTGIAAAIGVFHDLELRITSASVEVIVDGVTKGFITANIPTADMYFNMTSSSTTTTIGMDIDYVEIRQDR
jgi:PKD repeat protein